jgi:hypothetical protein
MYIQSEALQDIAFHLPPAYGVRGGPAGTRLRPHLVEPSGLGRRTGRVGAMRKALVVLVAGLLVSGVPMGPDVLITAGTPWRRGITVSRGGHN